jgi:hypothetical protein
MRNGFLMLISAFGLIASSTVEFVDDKSLRVKVLKLSQE